MSNLYFPPSKEGTLLQQAQYWLEKGVTFEANGNTTQAQMAFNMALKKEAEYNANRQA